MNLLNILVNRFGLNGNILLNKNVSKHLYRPSCLKNTNVLISPENSYFYKIKNDHFSITSPPLMDINKPMTEIMSLPQFINNMEYINPIINDKIITIIGNKEEAYVDQVTHEKLLFNKLRNDTKHRKRAFVKRGYFRRTRCLNRKLNRLSYAYALQGIDYEMLESLEMGELPDLKNFNK